MAESPRPAGRIKAKMAKIRNWSANFLMRLNNHIVLVKKRFVELTSWAARRPAWTAPLRNPAQTVALSVPAKCILQQQTVPLIIIVKPNYGAIITELTNNRAGKLTTELTN